VKLWRWATLLLAALSLTMESAHLLELPQKLQYSAELYSAVNTTMYRYFAIVGGVYQVGSIVAAWVLVYLLRGRGKAFAWTLAGALCLLAAFGAWLAIVAPVNGEIARALAASPSSVPELWMRLRLRWEGGHAVGFALQLLGLGLLLWSVVRETGATAARSATGEAGASPRSP
jgi:hypothetical protein